MSEQERTRLTAAPIEVGAAISVPGALDAELLRVTLGSTGPCTASLRAVSSISCVVVQLRGGEVRGKRRALKGGASRHGPRRARKARPHRYQIICNTRIESERKTRISHGARFQARNG